MADAKHTPQQECHWTPASEAVPCEGTRVFAETRDGGLIFCHYRDEEWQSPDGVHVYSVVRWMGVDELGAALAKATGSAQ